MDVQRVAPHAPHFAWFLHGFCMWNSLFFARHDTWNSLFFAWFCMWNSLFFARHDTWNSLFFAWFWHDMILHDMILHGMILHGFCTFFRTVLHVARLFA